MAIGLNRSGMLLVEVNNYTLGETRVWIKDREIPLEQFCGLAAKIFEEKNYQYAAGERFLERINRTEIAPGFYQFRERLALPKELLALETLLREAKNQDLALCPIEIAGFEMDFYDFTLFAEYFLTNSDLMSRRDPRLVLLEKLKSIKKRRY